jgi:hypothetical protein
VVNREIDAREALVSIAAELNSGFAIEPHANTRQELRDSLFLLFSALLATLGVVADNVLSAVANFNKGCPALGACERPLTRVSSVVNAHCARRGTLVATPRAIARIRALPCMRSLVCLEMATHCAAIVTPFK